MKLYTKHGTGRWVGTQAEAKSEFGAGHWEQDVPTDKASLIAFLNGHQVNSQNDAVVDVVAAPPRETTASEGKISATPNRYDVMDAANAASLQDLQSAVYKYLDRIDDALSLKKSA